MIGISVEDYGIGDQRHLLASCILDDLKAGVVSSFASEHDIEQRYGDRSFASAWPEFRRASRAFATLHGCLVLVDDDRRRFVDSKNIDGGYEQSSAAAFFWTSSKVYLSMTALQEKNSFSSVSARITLYRMPRADYSKVPWEYFFQRGEYVGEQAVSL